MGKFESKHFGHEARTDRKLSGATYTPAPLANAVAKNLLSKARLPTTGKIKLLDPGCGDGALTQALLHHLPQSVKSRLEVTCIDYDSETLSIARERLTEQFPDIHFEFYNSDFIEHALNDINNDVLYDIIIANPPYVRIQTLNSNVRERIVDSFGLTGRTDLAFAFIVAFTQLLSKSGCAAVITSNRILSTNAGKPVRELLLNQSSVLEVWDLGDTKLFDAAVLPAVIYFESRTDVEGNSTPQFTSVYETLDHEHTKIVDCESVCENMGRSAFVRTVDGKVYEKRRGTLLVDGTWRIGLSDQVTWVNLIKRNTWKTFADVSRVSVGVKTTADKVFIKEDWGDKRPELLRPLVTHHIAARYQQKCAPTREILYPHEIRDGVRSVVDLDGYPVSKSYFEEHKERLKGRQYVADAGREWYEIWVPHNPSDWDGNKIVFRDIAPQPTFWIETGKSIVNGDCYWLKLHEDTDPELIWLLLAVGNSTLVETFYDRVFNERLYAGRRRYMTRHVRQFPIPDPEHPSSVIASTLSKELALDDIPDERRHQLEHDVDHHITKAFGCD